MNNKYSNTDTYFKKYLEYLIRKVFEFKIIKENT